MRLLAIMVIVAMVGGARLVSAEERIATWTVLGKTHTAYYDETLRTFLSAACTNGPCGARDLLAKANTAKINTSDTDQYPPDGGWRIGARICEALGGTVALGLDQRRNENHWCVAPDQTIVNLRSLPLWHDTGETWKMLFGSPRPPV